MNEKTPEEAALDPAYDASNPEHIQKAKSAAGRKRKAESEVILALMGTTDGRAWIYSWLKLCHIFETSFARGNPDLVAFREGERNIGLQLNSLMVSTSVDLYVKMLKENTVNG